MDSKCEVRDLAAEQPKRVVELLEKLSAWQRAAGAKIPERNPQSE
ncbi:MAG: hypothetical protein WBA17_13535 [Saprospiraceae bacterium]